VAVLGGAACLITLSSAQAAEIVHVGKSLGTLWTFLPVDVGKAEGIFDRYGISLEIDDLGNGNKLQQGLASDSLDFGLGAGFFTFVGYDHFWDHDFRQFIVPRDRLAQVYRRSVFENHYRLDHGRLINEGLNRDRMAAFTHHDIRPMATQDLRRQEESRNVQARSNDLHDFKPGNARPNAVRPAGNQPNAGRPQPGGGNGNNNRSDNRADQRQ